MTSPKPGLRILVTGSREFDDLDVVRTALLEAVAGSEGPHTLVQGGARGADTLAAKLAQEFGWAVETHPADWPAPCVKSCVHGSRPARPDGGTYCPAAGHRRNQVMGDLGADVVVAFLKAGARNGGTKHCIRLAKNAGLTVRKVIG